MTRLTDEQKRELREHIEFERTHAKRVGLEDPTCGVHADALESLLDELEELRANLKSTDFRCAESAEEAAREYVRSMGDDEAKGSRYFAFLARLLWGRGRN